MAKGRVTVLRVIPGFTSLGPILRDFAKKGNGVVTSYSDALLPLCAQCLGDGAPVEVVSFGEIVRNVLVLCGEEALPIAQSGQKKAAIAHACSELPDASPFEASARFPGFHEAVSSTLDELRHWGIGAAEMEGLAEDCGTRLALKLRSLAELDRQLGSVLDVLGRQLHADQLAACLDATPELEGSLDRLLVIAGAEEDPLRTSWLKWLSQFGVEITVVLDRHATGTSTFARAQRSADQLGGKQVVMGDGNELTRNLFAETKFDGPPIQVSIASAADPLAESEWAIRGCLKDGNPHGAAIYVRDLEGYAPLIEAAAKRLQAPIRMARRADLLSNSFGRLTLSALRFCASADVRKLSPVTRSSYLGLGFEEQRRLESVLRDCYIQRGRQWSALEESVANSAESDAWLKALLEWRQRAIAGSYRLTEWFGYLKELNRDQRLPWVRLENKGGQMDERDRRALNQMERVLANEISVLDITGRRTVPLKEFVDLCESLWSNSDVSIPSGEQGIRVASDPDVIGGADRLFVLGMLEGVFPRRRSEDPVLTDADRSEISALRPGHPKLPDSRSKAQAERDEFYRVCSAAGKEIVFSYPLADDQKDNIPAFYLEEVRRAVPLASTHNYPRPMFAPAAEECRTEADIALRTAMDGPRDAPPAGRLISHEASDAIKPTPDAGFQPNVLRDALQCPFQSMFRHVLRVHPSRRQTRWHSLRKLPEYSQLLAKVDLAEAEHALIGALNAQLDQLYPDVPEWELTLLQAGGHRLIREWLRREAKSREHWPKEPGSMKVNVAFGSRGVRDTMPGGVKLKGQIPGISRLGRYNVAHLYGYMPARVSELSETQKLYIGLHLLAVHEPERQVALEMDHTSGERKLFVLGRDGAGPLPSSVSDGLRVVDLATSDEPSDAKKSFYREVNASLAAAVQRIVEARIDATPGDHCERCDYGELCRRSRNFGEDDALFEDEEPDDV